METAIIVALIGGGSGIITAIASLVFKIIEYRKKQKEETLDSKLAPAMGELKALAEEVKEVRLDTTRIQLNMKMEHEPHNHDTIIRIAHRYFCELGGNWVAAVDFQKWADKEKVKIPAAIQQAIVDNDKKK